MADKVGAEWTLADQNIRRKLEAIERVSSEDEQMDTFGRILVPLDGSSLGERSLAYVAALAPTGATVRLVHVVDDEDIDLSDSERARRLAVSYLNTSANALRKSSFAIESVVLAGQPAAAILSEADAWAAELVVMTTHGRSGFNRLRLGSVADRVICESGISTLAIGPMVAELPNLAIRTLVVPLDGSRFAEQALPVAALLAARLGAKTHLARVVPSPMVGEEVSGSPSLSELAGQARSYLEELRHGQGRIDTVVLVGSPAECLLTYIKRHSIDLVVLSSHKRTGMARLTLGSVADRLLRSLAPILMVR